MGFILSLKKRRKREIHKKRTYLYQFLTTKAMINARRSYEKESLLSECFQMMEVLRRVSYAILGGGGSRLGKG